MSRSIRALVIATAIAPAVVWAQDTRPVVVVYTFGASVVGPNHGDWDGVSTGVQDLLITDLASDERYRLVDRIKIAEVQREQNLVRNGDVDPQTAVKIGKIFGAQYAITGGWVADPSGNVRLTGRTIDMETTQISNPQTIVGKSADMLGMITQLSEKLRSQMKLAAKPGVRVGDATPAGAAPKSGAPAQNGAAVQSGAPASAVVKSTPPGELYAKNLSKSEMDKIHTTKLDAATMKLYSNALDEMDKKNNAKAIALLKQVSEKTGGTFAPAERNLRKLGA